MLKQITHISIIVGGYISLVCYRVNRLSVWDSNLIADNTQSVKICFFASAAACDLSSSRLANDHMHVVEENLFASKKWCCGSMEQQKMELHTAGTIH